MEVFHKHSSKHHYHNPAIHNSNNERANRFLTSVNGTTASASAPFIRKTSQQNQEITLQHRHRRQLLPQSYQETAKQRHDQLKQTLKQQHKEQLQSRHDQRNDKVLPSSSTSAKYAWKKTKPYSRSSANLPPLETLLSTTSRRKIRHKQANITGNVQFLLDFVVAGFGKCGTTTLLHWLRNDHHDNDDVTNSTSSQTSLPARVEMPGKEEGWLQSGQSAMLVYTMYHYLEKAQYFQKEKQHGTNNTVSMANQEKSVFVGFKHPAIMRQPRAFDGLRQYWPATRLIVTVRHPVSWMVSLYNFNLLEQGGLYQMQHGDKHNISSKLSLETLLDRDNDNFVSVQKGVFHALLAQAGKTPLREEAEWKLLEPWIASRQNLTTTVQDHPLPNEIFLMEMRQLNDTSLQRSQQFAHDVEAFLEFPKGQLDPQPGRVRPKGGLRDKKHLRQYQQVQHSVDVDDAKLHICDDHWKPLLDELMAVARDASDWLLQYFIPSPDVTVSNLEHLTELLQDWKVNPCDQVKEEDTG